MNSKNRGSSTNRKRSQAGMALVETMIALAVLLIVAVGVMSLGAIALATTENQGHLQARAAEYAQDKMEQLLALTFCDGLTDTTVFPAATTGGQGLAGCTNLTAAVPTASIGGSLNIAAPVAGYVDYVDNSGNPVASTQNWQYIRVWQISLPPGSTATSGLKQISVKCQVRAGVGNLALPPNATVVSIKSFPF